MNIFEFKSYKSYLKAYVKHLPGKGRGELSKLAEALDTHNTTLSQILNANKNLSLEQGLKLSTYLSLNEKETEYLFLLISYERSHSNDLKKYLLKKINIISTEEFSKINFRDKPSSASDDFKMRSVFYSSWDFAGVRVLTAINGGQSLEEISQLLSVPKFRIKEILEFLTAEGLCIYEKGRYFPGPMHTHLSAKSSLINTHRLGWRAKAIEKIGYISDQELMFSSPMSLSTDDFNEIKASIGRLIERTVKKARVSNAEVGACLNIDWFTFSK